MDGSYGASLDLRLPRADTVVWFDYPRLRVPGARRLANCHDLRPGSCLTWRPDVRSNSIWEFLRYVWDFNTKSRPQIVRMLERARSPSAAASWFRRDRRCRAVHRRPAGRSRD